MLIGQYTHELDSKKRLTLPAKWRKVLGSKVVVTNGLDNSLFVFSQKEWESIAEKLGSLSLGNSESRNFNRFFLSNAFEIDIDIIPVQGKMPAVFESAQLSYIVEGEVEPEKLLEAVKLSQTKYCSISAMLSKSFPIHYRVELNGAEIGSGCADFS